MDNYKSLQDYLRGWAGEEKSCKAVAEAIIAIAQAGGEIANLVAEGPLAGISGAVMGENVQGEAQKDLDVRADDLVIEKLRTAPVAQLLSEELEDVLPMQEDGLLCVAIDPLDGSSNIDTNVSIGTIFSILPMRTDGEDPFLRPGTEQLAAGFLVYGPQTAFVLTVGNGVQVFTLDRASGNFLLTRPNVQIPIGKREYAINASNYRYWDEAIRGYIDDCMSGADGPRGDNFNMRWVASLVAEAYRILVRGGIFLYPRDSRPGYQQGRLRLIYEANPIAFIVEQAGGAATDAMNRILDIVPTDIHQRIAFVFGSKDKVERVARYHSDPPSIGERSPLFGRRGLFRA